MSWQPRPITESEIGAYLTHTRRVFAGTTPSSEDIDAVAGILELDRTLAVFDRGQMVATTGIISYDLTVPDASVPAAGVSRVSVRATHRRRGLLTALMRRQLDDIRALGEPVAILWASEAPIYGRFGYGLATYGTRIEVRRASSGFRRPVRLDGLREIDAGEAAEVFPRLIERVAPTQPGIIRDRSGDQRWRLWLQDHPEYRRGASEQFLVVHDGPDGPDGFTLYRKQIDWANGSTLRVEDLLALNAQACAALWRHCLDVDLIAKVVAFDRSVDEPLRHLLADPRAAETTVGDALWLRLVDVAPALAARRYEREGSLRIEVRDEFCPWNAGVYLLEGGPDGAQCERVTAEPDLVLDADALGACYLGGNRLRVLAGAGLVAECTPGALARADAMFSWPIAPWCPVHF